MKLKMFLLGCSITAVIFTCLNYVFFIGTKDAVVVDTKETTSVTHDTTSVFIDSPTPRDSVVIRHETIKLPINDTVKTTVTDTLRVDSIAFDLPITQKEYQDSNYQAWVSGYNPCLDSIRVFQKNTTITNTICNTKVVNKTKRWGLGLQAGLNISSSKIEPYIGIGVSFNFFSW